MLLNELLQWATTLPDRVQLLLYKYNLVMCLLKILKMKV